MLRPLTWSRRQWNRGIFGAVALIAVLLAACASSPTPAPAPTPAPTRTPTPEPAPEVLPPITVDPEGNVREFLDVVPREERNCVVSVLGQSRLEEVRTRSDLADEEVGATLKCYSNSTLARITAGRFVSQIGSLSETTLRCIAEVDFSGIDAGSGNLAATLRGVEGGPGSEDFQQILKEASESISSLLSAVIPSLFCLSAPERAAMEAADDFRFPDIDAMECTVDELGEGGLDILLETFVYSRLAALFSTDAPVEAPVEARAAAVKCGLDVARG